MQRSLTITPHMPTRQHFAVLDVSSPDTDALNAILDALEAHPEADFLYLGYVSAPRWTACWKASADGAVKRFTLAAKVGGMWPVDLLRLLDLT